MEPLALLKEALEKERPVSWSDMPDISLYMDQIISYMPRQLITTDNADQLTPAMVNNYIKDGLLPRADGKRYSRVHLAYLTAICALKRVLSVREIKVLLQESLLDQEPEVFYDAFLKELDMALKEAEEALSPMTEEELTHAILAFALRSYANQLVCARLLAPLFEKQGIEQRPNEKEKGKK